MINPAAIVIILTIIQAIHLVEEVKAGFRKKLPFGKMPRWLMVAGNALGHLTIMLLRKKYFPGGYTAPPLLLLPIYLLVRLAQL